jgi:mannosyltransferase
MAGSHAVEAPGPPTRSLAVTTFLVSFAVVFAWSWRPALSSDEAASVVVVRRSWHLVWRVWDHDAALMPYYLVLKLWADMTSTAPAVLRLPSVVAMSAAVTVLVVLVHAIVDLRTAVASGIVMVCLPAVSRFGQDARPYAFAMLFTTLAVAAWWRYLHEGRRRDAFGYGLAAVLATLAHVYAMTILVALVAAAAAVPTGERARALRRTAVPAAVATALLVPYLVFVSGHATGQPGVPGVSPYAVARVAAYLPVSLLHAPLAPVCAGLVAVAAVLGAASGLRASAGVRTQALTRVALAWLVIPPVLLTLLQALTGRPGLVARYWGIATPGLAVLVGLFVSAAISRVTFTRRRVAAVALVGTALLAGLPAQVDARGIDGHTGERWRLLPAVLRQPLLAGLPVLISPSVSRALDAAAPDVVRRRVPSDGDAAQAGLLAANLLSTDSPQFRRFLDGSPAFIAYRPIFTDVSRVPTRSQFNPLVSPATPDTRLVIRCDYFGDALGVFSTGQALPTSWIASAAAQIRAVAGSHVTCRVAA